MRGYPGIPAWRHLYIPVVFRAFPKDEFQVSWSSCLYQV